MKLQNSQDAPYKSWVETANLPDADFPIQNLPYGIFSRAAGSRRAGVAIGDQILDLSVLEAAGLLRPSASAAVFDKPDINAFMALGPAIWSATRAAIVALLDLSQPRLRDDTVLRSQALVPMADAALHLPIFVRSFTDFYASKEHATNVGAMFRDPANALMPNWLHIPIGYNGRASTVVVSETDIYRPLGQTKPAGQEVPSFGPCDRLDFELELGAIVGTANPMGKPLTLAEADAMIFGFVLLNDWSARDIQAWEYQPLGPFQSKAFATSISPWVITREALEPFRVDGPAPILPLLPYLQEKTAQKYNIHLKVTLQPALSGKAEVISETNYRFMYYSSAQQMTHHAVGGCAMCVGDLLGSGTVSGPTPDSLGSLLEITNNGRKPLQLTDGSVRRFLADGDRLVLSGWCAGETYRIGFGTCAGKILPSPSEPSW